MPTDWRRMKGNCMYATPKHKKIILTLLTLTQLLVIIDGSIVNIALPAIKDALHFSSASLQWVITAYILFFGGSLMLGSRLSDRFGQRKLLAIGTAGFTMTSLLLGLSQTSNMLIVLRCFQGVSAAIMTSSALSILLTVFKEGHERNKALSLWGLAGSAGGAIGVLLGGVLTQHLGWRSIFLVNVPVGALVLAGILYYAKEDVSLRNDKKLDIPGAALITGAVMALVYALSQAPQVGWTAFSTVISGLVGVVLSVGFLMREKRAVHPIIPLSIFRVRSVSIGNIAMLILIAVGMGQFYFNALYLQNILHYSSEAAGIAFLPIPIAVAATIAFVPRMLGKVGYKYLLATGAALIGVGAIFLTRLTTESAYVTNIVPAFLFLGVGFGVAVVSANVAATSGVGHDKSGIVSGLVNTSQQIGGALGIAVLTVVASLGTTGLGAITMHGYHLAYVGIAVLSGVLLLTALRLGRVVQPAEAV